MIAIHTPDALVNAAAHDSTTMNGDAWVDACEDDTPSYQYTGVTNLFKTIAGFEGDGFKVIGVPPKAQQAIWKYRDNHRRKIRLSYLANEDPAVLLVAIPTAGHEHMHTGFTAHLQRQAHQMGISMMQLRPAAATTYPQNVNGEHRGTGEGDATFIPTAPSRFWPSVAVEVGCSHSLDTLQAKARWWFAASEHQVKIVLLVKHFGARRSIVLQKWVEADVPVPAGRAASSQASAQDDGPSPTTPQMVRDQLITISLAGDMDASNPGSFGVTRSPLVLEFRNVLLREPEDHESDFIFSEAMLQEYAAFVWLGMGQWEAMLGMTHGPDGQ